MTNQSYIYGNLALDTNILEPKIAQRPFKVVNGYKDSFDLHFPVDHVDEVQDTLATHRLQKVLFFVAVIITVFTLIIFVSVSSEPATISGEESFASASHASVIVRSGDTLWGIAQQYPVENMSTKELVSVIREWNNLESPVLQPGQTLIVAS